MIEVINLEKYSPDGYKMPANNPSYVFPDNVTHAQLRYNTFTSSYVVQGTAVSGSNSTFEFDLSEVATNYKSFKLYSSTDGTNYTEIKSYGGSNGRTINRPPIELTLIVTQDGTNAPDVTVYDNNSPLTYDSSTYDGVGFYIISFTPALNDVTIIPYAIFNGVVIPSGGANAGTVGVDFTTGLFNDTGDIYIYSNNTSNVAANDILNEGVFITIRLIYT